MVRRQYQHHGFPAAFLNHRCRQSNTGSCIAAAWFGQNVFCWQFRQLFLHKGSIPLIGDYINGIHLQQGFQTVDRLLQHGFLVRCQGKELFWFCRAAAWPEAFASSTCHNNSSQFHDDLFSFFSSEAAASGSATCFCTGM